MYICIHWYVCVCVCVCVCKYRSNIHDMYHETSEILWGQGWEYFTQSSIHAQVQSTSSSVSISSSYFKFQGKLTLLLKSFVSVYYLIIARVL